jgi:cyclic pyranopterin phosphate synthase
MTEASSSQPAPAPADVRGRPLRDLRISVTDRCNFRCPYCMPADVFGDAYKFLPRAQILTFEEIERVARIFVELGVTKLRITGGEPLLRSELPRLVARLAALPGVADLALTTNGSLLDRHAKALRDAGLSRLTVSLDSLREDTFRKLSGGRIPLSAVLSGIEAAERVGFTRLKINTVVIAGENEDELLDLARRFRHTPHILRLIEYMDVGTRNAWAREQVVSARTMLERIGAVFPLEPVAPHAPSEVAKRYRYADGAGEIGIIASVTQPFCSTCTRARLSAEGELFTCLFASHGTDLKTPLRASASDAELRERIGGTWRARGDRYSEIRAELPEQAAERVEMYHIGG